MGALVRFESQRARLHDVVAVQKIIQVLEISFETANSDGKCKDSVVMTTARLSLAVLRQLRLQTLQ